MLSLLSTNSLSRELQSQVLETVLLVTNVLQDQLVDSLKDVLSVFSQLLQELLVSLALLESIASKQRLELVLLFLLLPN